MALEDPRIGSVLHGRYRVVERLTQGSMGVVYLGQRLGLDRSVAIKFLHESYASTEDGMRRFEVEARAMSRLTHPNCVPVTDFGVDHGAPYLVMDFVAGRTLREVLRDEGRVAPARVVDLVRQILAGVAHAHGHGIIHRDLKPENILVSPVEGHGEQVRLLDFGLAKLRDDTSFTTGLAVGTPSYMSPEQTVAQKADGRADLYAIGVITFELLTGTKPFHAASPFEVMRMHRDVPPPPLAHAAPDVAVSPELEAVVQRALAKAREERWADTAEFLAALEAVPEAARQEGGRPERRRRGALGLAGLVAAAGLLGALAWSQSRGSVPEVRPVAAAGKSQESSSVAAPPASSPAAATPERAGAPAPPAAPAAADVGADETAENPAADAGNPADDDAVARAVERWLEHAAEGQVTDAITRLDGLRRDHPGRAEVHYALGQLQAEAQRWDRAVEAYAQLLLLDASFAQDPRLIADVVEALGTDAHASASELIRHHLRDHAVPRLEEATRSANASLRARAKRLHRRLTR